MTDFAIKILLPLAIEFKGSCHGITATQVERTDTKALFKRSDGYFECFYINETSHNIFLNGEWLKSGDTVERYPSDERFGASAWCGREKTIREQYERLNAVSEGDALDNLERSTRIDTVVPFGADKG